MHKEAGPKVKAGPILRELAGEAGHIPRQVRLSLPMVKPKYTPLHIPTKAPTVHAPSTIYSPLPHEMIPLEAHTPSLNPTTSASPFLPSEPALHGPVRRFPSNSLNTVLPRDMMPLEASTSSPSTQHIPLEPVKPGETPNSLSDLAEIFGTPKERVPKGPTRYPTPWEPHNESGFLRTRIANPLFRTGLGAATGGTLGSFAADDSSDLAVGSYLGRDAAQGYQGFKNWVGKEKLPYVGAIAGGILPHARELRRIPAVENASFRTPKGTPPLSTLRKSLGLGGKGLAWGLGESSTALSQHPIPAMAIGSLGGIETGVNMMHRKGEEMLQVPVTKNFEDLDPAQFPDATRILMIRAMQHYAPAHLPAYMHKIMTEKPPNKANFEDPKAYNIALKDYNNVVLKLKDKITAKGKAEAFGYPSPTTPGASAATPPGVRSMGKPKLTSDSAGGDAGGADWDSSASAKPNPDILNTGPTDSELNTPSPYSWSDLSNMQKGLALGAGSLGAGALGHYLSPEEEDEKGKRRKTMPWLGPAIGLGGIGLSAHLLSGGNYSKLLNRDFWRGKTASVKPSLITYPWKHTFEKRALGIPGLPNPLDENTVGKALSIPKPPVAPPVTPPAAPIGGATPGQMPETATMGGGVANYEAPQDALMAGGAPRPASRQPANEGLSEIDLTKRPDNTKTYNLPDEPDLSQIDSSDTVGAGKPNEIPNPNDPIQQAPGNKGFKQEALEGYGRSGENQPEYTPGGYQARANDPMIQKVNLYNQLKKQHADLPPATLWQKAMNMWEGMNTQQKWMAGIGLGLGLYGLGSSLGGAFSSDRQGNMRGMSGMGILGPLMAAGGLGLAAHQSGLLGKMTGGMFGVENKGLNPTPFNVPPPRPPLPNTTPYDLTQRLATGQPLTPATMAGLDPAAKALLASSGGTQQQKAQMSGILAQADKNKAKYNTEDQKWVQQYAGGDLSKPQVDLQTGLNQLSQSYPQFFSGGKPNQDAIINAGSDAKQIPLLKQVWSDMPVTVRTELKKKLTDNINSPANQAYAALDRSGSTTAKLEKAKQTLALIKQFETPINQPAMGGAGPANFPQRGR